jgi:sec-independent protein translocase protein TatA
VDIGPPELILILVAVLVLFGGAQLPKLARNLGKAQQEFKKGLSAGQDDDDPIVESPAEETKSESDHPT